MTMGHNLVVLESGLRLARNGTLWHRAGAGRVVPGVFANAVPAP